MTVVLCTLNRAQRLRSTLADLAKQEMPPGRAWEVLIVDNGSTDDTPAVAAEWMRDAPERFRYVSEPRRGKSFALNTGVDAARAPLLAFTDDDVEIDPRWLPEMLRMFEQTGCAGVGGRTLARFAVPPPDWLAGDDTARHILAPLAQFDLGSEPVALQWSPYGVNVAFRRAMFERHGGYRTDLGPTASDRNGRGEDIDFGGRVIDAGEVVMYAPQAIIRHFVPAERMTERYFAAWWFYEGRSSERRWHERDSRLRRYVRIPRYLARMARAVAEGALASDGRSRRVHKLELMEHLGQTVEAALQTRRK